MSRRVLIALAFGCLIGFSSGIAVCAVQRATEMKERRERFFGADTPRDIPKGQEMRPRW